MHECMYIDGVQGRLSCGGCPITYTVLQGFCISNPTWVCTKIPMLGGPKLTVVQHRLTRLYLSVYDHTKAYIQEKKKEKKKKVYKNSHNFLPVFWVNIGLILQNLKLICVIETVQTYLGFGGERLNFGITVAEIQPKV